VLEGQFNEAILEGLKLDQENGGKGWSGLETQVADEEGVIALAYTSGTTARPKGVEYTHRGVYLAAMANIVESSLNPPTGRCKYLWTLPMFHAAGT
jgi:acyl-CoA synthetase (AMP-forming)/AMP-acid ligase II